MICHLEWDLLAGPMRRLMLTLMLVSPIQLGQAGVAAGAVGAAGAGLRLTGTRGGKTTN